MARRANHGRLGGRLDADAGPDEAAAIGVDIGGTNLRAARISSRGEILERLSERIVRDADTVVERIASLVSRLDRPGVRAIGIGVPGRVDAGRRQVLSGGYLDLSGAALAERIDAASGKPVVIDNDCNMALIGEIAVGAGVGRENVVMFTIGTGIGGAAVEEGRVVRGRRSAGQLGHITVNFAGEPCACGRHGCVETTSSGTALGRAVAAAGLPAGTDADGLFALAAGGNAVAAGVLERWAAPLRAAIDSMVATFDPDLVLLGGGLGHAAYRAVSALPPPSEWYRCPVEPAALGDDAGVIGAGVSALVETYSSTLKRASRTGHATLDAETPLS